MTIDLLTDDFSGHCLIEASAGTGKTWTLTMLYARLLLERQLSVGRILVVTYTNAATAELRERIRDRLAELLAVYEGHPTSEPLLERLWERFPDPESERRLRLAVHGFDEAAIFTIHSFCQRALQDAAFEAGSEFDNCLSRDDREVLDALLEDLWRAELAHAEPAWGRFLARQKITPVTLRKQLQPHLGKPYLQVLPEPLISGDFPDLEPLWQRVGQQWKAEGEAWLAALRAHNQLNGSTHKKEKFSLWQRELEAFFADPAALLQEKPVQGLIKLGQQAVLKACKKGSPPLKSKVAEALDHLHQAQVEALPQAKARLVQLQARLLHQLNEALPQRKAALRLQAFDDLLNQLQQALDASGGRQLARTLRTQYPLALIDEFQDTDPIQYAIFSRIYAQEPQESQETESTESLCFVGDPKQAIYGFRGADLATYLQARERAERCYTLPVNYRSTPGLIDALNRLFARPRPFSEACLKYPPVQAASRPREECLVLPPELDGAPLSLVWLGDTKLTKGQAENLAAQDCARRIAALLVAADRQQAVFIKNSQPRPLQGGDIAILVPGHREAALMAEALGQRGVPCVRRGREHIWQSEEAVELAAVLAAYAEPNREGLLRYALATRLLGRSAAELMETQEQQALWDQEREVAERYHQRWLQQGFLRLFRSWLDEQQVAKRLLQRPDGERRLTNLLHLGELLQTESIRLPSMESLLAWFAEQRQGEAANDEGLLRLESDAERVQIVTIHTSKGLEYPLVFCPFLWGGRLLGKNLSSARCHDDQGQPLLDLGSEHLAEHLQRNRAECFAEQLRLAYVAVTRARERLWIHWGAVNLPSGNGTQSDGLHTSAMAWLLHGRHLAGEDALTELNNHLLEQTPSTLRAELEAWVATSGESVCCLPCADEVRCTQTTLRAPAPQQLSQVARSLRSAWRIGSFSGLAAGLHMEAPDRDRLGRPDPSLPGEGFFAFPRGARAGTCLHAILEYWAVQKGPLAELVAQALQAHGLPEDSCELVTAQLERVLACDLDGQGLTLAGIPPARRLPELGFTFPVHQLDVTQLRELLVDPRSGLPAPLRQAAQQLEFDGLHGFLKGFIDLTFEHQGRWYIVDYKSNWLGPDEDHYRPAQLEQALAEEHYYLQYLIYLVALRRFLRQRLADFQPEMLGGAFYLFLRGMPEAGVYFARPTDDLLDALEQLFAGDTQDAY